MVELDPELYTIAWLAPLEIEAQAALHMLDKRHQGRFPMGRGDDYVFQAGEICGHYVIVATLPAGQEYGTGSAAALASQVKKFFPNLWFGLLVGVAAGLPNLTQTPPLDIRLGDVLVGLPTGKSAGLVAYDLGKKTAKDGFQPLRFGHALASTETVVRSAIGSIKLKAPNDIEAFLPYYETIKLQKHSSGTFIDPGQERDKLYLVDDSGTERLVERERRPDDMRVRVWYGPIGSGEKLMKNTQKRNELRDKYGVIGLEMEAAGTMNRIPVGVIRGVCDYGDEHKNKEWQPYAAAMAAAYAKVLLSEIPPRTKKRRYDVEYPASIIDDRSKKYRSCEEVAEASSSNGRVTQSISDGQGIQAGGNLSVWGNTIISPNDFTFPDDLWEEFLGDLAESDPRTDMCRIESDKGGFLEDCFSWILEDSQLKDWQDNKDTRLLWIKGDPGKGKTMLMIGLVNGMTDRLRPHESCVFFFCQNTEPHLNNGVSVLRGLIWKLLSENRTLSRYIPAEYRFAAKDKRKALFESNSNRFFILKTMLSAMLKDAGFEAIYLLVDALDECDKDSDRLVEWIADDAADPQSKAKWLVSGRPNQMLTETFRPDGQLQKLSLELNHKHVSQAVSLFIKRKVEALAKKKQYDEVLRTRVEHKLVEKAESTFLWVALVCQRLAKIPRLETLVELNKFPSKLQPLYDRMMQLVENQEGSSRELCKQILRAVTIAYSPLTLDEIVPIAGLHERSIEDICELVSLCGSYIILQEKTIRFVHQSAKDYLNGVAEFFPGGREQEHGRIVERSLQAMSKTLRRNIYGLHHLGLLIGEIKAPPRDPLAAIRYSCVYWIGHFCDAYSHSDWVRSVAFSHDSKLLASGSSDKTIKIWDAATGSLQQTLEGHNGWVYSVALSHDSKLLASGSYDKTIKIWNAATGFLQQTFEGHNDAVLSVIFSHDSKLLASGSFDKTIKIWNTETGSLQQTFEGHSDIVLSVMFSYNSKLLASGSGDKTAKIWDTAKGSLQQTLEGHNDEVSLVTFSYDSKLLASGSYDKTIKLWDAATGSLQQTFEGHNRWIYSVAFSPDSKLLASGSYDKTIKIWNTATGSLHQTLEGHSSWVSSVTFSYYSKLLASGSGDKTIKTWDIATGSLQQTFEGHNDAVNSITFSHDSKLLASGSGDKTVKIWDTVIMSLQTLEGHNGWVWSVAFSYDSKLLASGSEDKTVKIWNTATGSLQQIFDLGITVQTISFDDTGLSLNTEIGRIDLAAEAKKIQPLLRTPHPNQSQEVQYYGYALSRDRSWITWNKHNVVWLPTDYRPSTYTISSFASPSTPSTVTKIGLGYGSGRVVVIGLLDSGPL
ncbi:hypothetical protein DL768_011361 [Monosporascus sp. mg162]|nr:hypothetical protein DL768_011361 [Monosporascus sp. mg162]